MRVSQGQTLLKVIYHHVCMHVSVRVHVDAVAVSSGGLVCAKCTLRFCCHIDVTENFKLHRDGGK